jgi:phospholipid transport system substrate-binding protein
MLKRFFYSLVAILFFGQVTSLQAVPTSSQSKESAKSFIEDLGRRAVESLTRSGVSQSELESNFQALLEEGFDVPAIGQFVMGRYWNRMSPDQQARFIPLFENRLKKSYANRFQEYRGVNFIVKDARKQSSYFVVSSTIQRPGGP